ncbi:peptidyl-prolyl cis-trans isomerase [Simkania negevensis]|uniref:peptidylprolyl isomerase n=1 Tax=Simkania negevensis TaxID=83561 RepID=A0ABS3ASE3_9BACT|nr:peptidyl-prolyl cis-trans isomerase [Simkania negevensis]
MLRKSLLILGSFFVASVGQPACCEAALLPPLEPDALFAPKDVAIENRVLAKINGKVITVMDVVKKMDVVFHQEFPQYVDSLPARYQFYQTNWRVMLDRVVDNELILADAKEKKVVVNEGEVRKELEHMLGPNVVKTVDELGLTFDEAWQMVSTDLIVKKMISYMVHSKAWAMVGPSEIYTAYEQFAKEYARREQWRYSMLSVRSGGDREEVVRLVDLLNTLLHQEGLSFNEAVEALEVREEEGAVKISVSPTYERAEHQLSAQHKNALAALKVGQYSVPIEQKDNTTWRIFHLEGWQPAEIPAFQNAQLQVKNGLFEQAVVSQTQKYIEQLRNHFLLGPDLFEVTALQNFQPFSMI